MLRLAMRRRFQISPQAAADSRAKIVAAIDRLEREISPSGYFVGDSFTVADLTAAALLYPVARPPEFPYAMVTDEDISGASFSTRSASDAVGGGSPRSTVGTAAALPS
jgi:glutathione S-transferase